MLPKKVNCQSSRPEFDDEEIEKAITNAEISADRALQDVVKKENYSIKRKREKTRNNQ